MKQKIEFSHAMIVALSLILVLSSIWVGIFIWKFVPTEIKEGYHLIKMPDDSLYLDSIFTDRDSDTLKVRVTPNGRIIKMPGFWLSVFMVSSFR